MGFNHQTEAEREEREAYICSLPRSSLEEEHGGQLIQGILRALCSGNEIKTSLALEVSLKSISFLSATHSPLALSI